MKETIDPVCGKKIDLHRAHIILVYRGEEYLLCSPACQREFERDPKKHIKTFKKRLKKTS